MRPPAVHTLRRAGARLLVAVLSTVLVAVLLAVVVLARAALDRLPGPDTGPLAFAVRPFLAAAVAFVGLRLRRVSPVPPRSS